MKLPNDTQRQSFRNQGVGSQASETFFEIGSPHFTNAAGAFIGVFFLVLSYSVIIRGLSDENLHP
jgi:hypothetical protein